MIRDKTPAWKLWRPVSPNHRAAQFNGLAMGLNSCCSSVFFSSSCNHLAVSWSYCESFESVCLDIVDLYTTKTCLPAVSFALSAKKQNKIKNPAIHHRKESSFGLYLNELRLLTFVQRWEVTNTTSNKYKYFVTVPYYAY